MPSREGVVMKIERRRVLKMGGFGVAAAALLRNVPALGAEPFRIGALNPVTGAGSPYGSGMQKAIILSADEVNAAGGAAGLSLKIFAEDSQTSPPAAEFAGKKPIPDKQGRAVLR